MPILYDIKAARTYASKENVIKAIEKKYAGRPAYNKVRYIIVTDFDGRFFPVFIGHEAVELGIHFDFNIVA